MEEFLQNSGLVHLGEKIFGYLPDQDLVKCLLVSKSWHSFLTYSAFWKKRWQQKMDLILTENTFVPKLEDDPFEICPKKTLFEYYPEWKEICDYINKEESLANFQMFVTVVKKLSDKRYANSDPLELALCLSKDPQPNCRHCPQSHEFIKLLLRCPAANFSDSLNIVIGQQEYEKVELLLNHGDKTKIDINRFETDLYSTDSYTALHTLAEDCLVKQTEPYLKIMFDNAEKYGLDINARNSDGLTPFESMCLVKPYKSRRFQQWSFKNKLDCWLDYPELFTPNNFCLASKEKLANLIIELHQEKLQSGEGTGDLDKKLNLPQNRKCKKSKGLTKYALREANLKKKTLVLTVWELYQERIKAYGNAKKRAVSVKKSYIN